MMTLKAWLRDTGGNLVWNSLVLVTVFVPLGGLSIDVSRYFLLRSTLATGADAAAIAAAQCTDITHFQNTGETRLMPECAEGVARSIFAANMVNLVKAYHHPQFTQLDIDEMQDEVTIRAQGDIRLAFGLTPAFTVQVISRSRFRMISR